MKRGVHPSGVGIDLLRQFLISLISLMANAAELKMPNGDTYSGEVDDGLRHGQGVYT